MFLRRISDNEAIVGQGDDGGTIPRSWRAEMMRGVPLSMYATRELVVPRSIPTMRAIVVRRSLR